MKFGTIVKWGFALVVFTPFVLLGLMLIDDYFNVEVKKKDFDRLILECKQSAASRDFKTAYKKVDELKNLVRWSYDRDKYDETYDYIFREEALYLCASDDVSSLNRISFLLSSIQVEGSGLPNGTQYNNSYWHEIIDNESIQEHKRYSDYVTKFNQKCDLFIDLAITNKKYRIIENVYPLYKLKPDPLQRAKEVFDSDSINKKYVVYYITYSNKDKENAKLKINNAIRNGSFPGITEEIS